MLLRHHGVHSSFMSHFWKSLQGVLIDSLPPCQPCLVPRPLLLWHVTVVIRLSQPTDTAYTSAKLLTGSRCSKNLTLVALSDLVAASHLFWVLSFVEYEGTQICWYPAKLCGKLCVVSADGLALVEFLAGTLIRDLVWYAYNICFDTLQQHVMGIGLVLVCLDALEFNIFYDTTIS